MNRLSDIFTRTTRVITVVCSLLFVLALHIDSGEILRQIKDNPEVRARLNGMADTSLSQASKIFDNADRATAALSDVKKKHSGKTEDARILAVLDKAAPHLTNCVDGKRWLLDNSKDSNSDLLKEFDEACQKETLQAAGNSYDQIVGLRTDLEKTGLKIIPAEVSGKPVFYSFNDWSAAYGDWRHLGGTFVSVLLLSLGAPFWFNMLRQLSNLKPAIAGKVGDAKPDAAK